MEKRIKIVNPLNDIAWNESVISGPHSSFFHTANWASVLVGSYDYKPLYFLLRNEERITAIVPLMEINTFFSARRGVSLPFTDCCDPYLEDFDQFTEVVDSILDYGKKAGWSYFELRTSFPLPPGIQASETFQGHLLDITGSKERILAGFRDSNRRNIRKAEKEGVSVTIDDSEESVREFYRLNCMTRRDHGLPCQPFRFFKNVYSHIIAKNFGVVALASINGKIVAGAIFFHFGGKAIYKYGASDRAYQHLRCNNLIMWKAIQWYRNNGFKLFDFGRTEQENSGLMQFKRGWGAEEVNINYCKYDFRKRAFVTNRSKVSGWHNQLFRMMPVPMLRVAGAMLYRHVG